jgi:hypothetical protein
MSRVDDDTEDVVDDVDEAEFNQFRQSRIRDLADSPKDEGVDPMEERT